MSQFSHTMTAQCDLRVEAAHVERFYRDFAGVASQVRAGGGEGGREGVCGEF